MPLPAILDVAEQHLFSDRDRMLAEGVPAVTADHVIRLRDVYNYWLSFPNRRDRDIVDRLMRMGVSRSQAYTDLKIIKALLGNFSKTTKDYHRYRFTEMIRRAYDKAEAANDTRAMVAAADKYAKYMQLDKEDERENIYELIPRQPFKVTDDPSVIGIKPIPNIREKIRAKKEQYWSEDIQDVQFEDVEFNPDDIFNVPKHGNSNQRDIS